ncbi:MAG: hypothetical protein ACI837_001066 [Crocinitomicaceae bacterium]|jgi:hypothetical protein
MTEEEVKLERKKFLKELNATAKELAFLLEGDDPPALRVKQYKKYLVKSQRMLVRISSRKDGLTIHSFKGGYGGKLLARKELLKMGIIKEVHSRGRKKFFECTLDEAQASIELASRLIVEVYLKKNGVESY